MATSSSSSSSLLSRLQIRGLPPPPLLHRHGNGNGNCTNSESSRFLNKRDSFPGLTSKRFKTYCFLGVTEALKTETSCSNFNILHIPLEAFQMPQDLGTSVPKTSHDAISGYVQQMVLADLDPATAKLAIGILGPFLSAFAFLFVIRIVMSWYPKLPVGKFPYVIAYVPTEPILNPTRKLIPPLGGVDVTPVVWFALISFLNEILLGPQGLLVLLSQQV